MSARVLVIDDQPNTAEDVADAFRAEGFLTDVAYGGQDGVALYRARAHDLIVTDLMMPEFDGIETIRTIRQQGGTAKIIAMSGGGFMKPEMLLALAEKLGADAAVAKPFRPAQLVATARDLLAAPQRLKRAAS